MKNPARCGWRHARHLTLLASLGLTCAASATPRTYRYFRFTPTQVRAGTDVQLSEFRFFNGGTALPLTSVTVTNPGGFNTPTATEGAMKAIDGNTATKWLDKGINRPLIFDFTNPVTIDAYDYTTANDASDRDPVSWTLEGSDDNLNWELLDQVKQAVVPTQRFAAVAQYGSGFNLHPVIITEFKPDKSVVLNGDPINLSWITRRANAGVMISPAPGVVTEENTSNVYPTADSDTTYTLTGANTVDGTHSASFTVRSVTGGSVSHRYLRFTPTKLRKGNLANSVQLAEFGFLNGVTPIPVTAVTNPGGNTPANEIASKLTDNDITTKWLDFNKKAVIFDLGSNTTPVTHYYFTTANDAPERDPIRWTLEGSDDNINWTLVDNLNTFDVGTPLARRTRSQDFPFPGESSIPPIATLSGDAPILFAGEPLVLQWTSSAAVAVEITGPSGPIDPGLPLSGTYTVYPTADTTYTITATSANGYTDVKEFSVDVVTPTIDKIAYSNFDNAGEEIKLIQSASIVNDFANFPQPGDQKRLRLTPNVGSVNGTAWFIKRVDLSQGFQTFIDFQMANLSGGSGADGMAFVIQNHPGGNSVSPPSPQENGLPSQALNIKFDSYQNEGEPSAAHIQILAGTTPIASANLVNFPGLLRGIANDLTIASGSIAPYRARIDYVPGDMDVYIDGIPVITNANVNLADPSIAAVDANGKAYVGFSARTGGISESHDVTRWFLYEGIPAPDLKVLSHSINPSSGEITLTWASSPNRTYRITRSTNLSDWSQVIQSGIQGNPSSTTLSVSFPPDERQFFRIEEE